MEISTENPQASLDLPAIERSHGKEAAVLAKTLITAYSKGGGTNIHPVVNHLVQQIEKGVIRYDKERKSFQYQDTTGEKQYLRDPNNPLRLEIIAWAEKFHTKIAPTNKKIIPDLGTTLDKAAQMTSQEISPSSLPVSQVRKIVDQAKNLISSE